MSDYINLSEKYGVNPTIPVCFWCGEKKNEVVLLGKVTNFNGEEIMMPTTACIDYEPCDKCKENMDMGFMVFEATQEPNDVTSKEIQPGIYPTGNWVVVRKESAKKMFIFDDPADYERGKVAMLPDDFGRLFNDLEGEE